jgi:hypothetical protein
MKDAWLSTSFPSPRPGGREHLVQGQRLALSVAGDRPGGKLGQDLRGSLDLGDVCHRDLEPLAADLALQLVRRAAGDHRTVVDHHDLVGQPIGLLQILGGE